MSSNNRKVVKAGLGYTIGNYLLKGVVFITTPIFARLMTTADYGKYSVFTSYESIFFVIIGLAIHTSYKNAYYKFRNSSDLKDETLYRKYLSATFCFIFCSLVFWLLIAIVFNNQISTLLGIDHNLLYILVIGSMITAIVNCYSTDMGIHYQYKTIIVISLVSTCANIGLSLALMNTIFNDRMYLGRILGGFIPALIIYTAIALSYIFRASPSGMSKGLVWGIRYSIPIVPHGISQVILTQFDRIMIKRMIGDDQAGIYSFSYTIFSILAVTSSSIDGIWSPWFYEKRKNNDYEAIKKGSSVYIFVVFLASLCVISFCPEIIAILGGDKYKNASYCAIPIVVGGFFSCIYNVPCLVEYYYEKTKLIAVSTASAAIINILLNALFIPKYGYVAAAYTTLFTYSIYFLAHYIMAIKIEKKNLFSNGLIVACAMTLLVYMFLSLFFMKIFIIRFIVTIIISFFFIIYEEKQYSFLSQILRNRVNGRLNK